MQEHDLFTEALSRTDPAELAAFLDQACAGNPELRTRLDELLASHARSRSPLARTPLAPGEATESVDLATALVTREQRPDEGTETLAHVDPKATTDVKSGASTPPTDVTGEFRSDRADTLDHADSDATTASSKAPTPRAARVTTGEGIGTVIAGRYTLVEVIGEGGMGSVYLASQTEPVKRQVALKLIKTGMDSRGVLARFDAERQALALMDHPNIARIYDGGVTPAGQPFFVMELVHGVPLTEYCDQRRLSVKDRLELFVSVCLAVQHAHQKGIIHRDLKPGNVLVTEVDGKPTPKVIDFGVAKATEVKLTDMSFADVGAIVGTPTYMSPEQADPSSMDIDTRTDIYALGVMLYELLTGAPPIDASQFKRGAILEMLRMVREVDPPRPSTKLSTADALPNIAANRSIEPARLSKLLQGELDWVVMKALEKDRTRRYDTANGFARDIQRYLADEVVEARPPSRGYRMKKFVKRNKGQVIAASVVFLTLVGGVVGTSIGLVRADRALRAEETQRKIAVQEKKKAEAREELAIDAVKKFRDAVADNEVLKNPALESLQKKLLKEPLEFFHSLRDRLQADKDTRPESLARLARASFDLGKLTDQIGDKQNALIAYRESLTIRQKLAEANPAVTEFRRDLATSYNSIGGILDATGKTDEAMKVLNSALTIRQKLAEANPTVVEFQLDVAMTIQDIAITLRDRRKPTEALKASTALLAMLQKLADAHPVDSDIQDALANGYLGIAVDLRINGKPAETFEAYKSALAILRKQADAHPADTERHYHLAIAQHDIGNALRELRKPDEAMKAYELALAISQKLADANPTVTNYQEDLARTQNDIGIQLAGTERPDESLKAFEVARKIRQKLADDNPKVVSFQSSLAGSHDNVGIMLRQMGQSAEAPQAPARRPGYLIRRKLIREYPDSPDFKSELGANLNNLAQIDLVANRFEEARVRVREAIEWQRKALAASPANPQYRRFLSNHLSILIKAARGLNRDEEAAEAERELAKLRDPDAAMAALDKQLAAVLAGKAPEDNAGRLWPWLSGRTTHAATPPRPPRSSGPKPWRSTPTSPTTARLGIATTLRARRRWHPSGKSSMSHHSMTPPNRSFASKLSTGSKRNWPSGPSSSNPGLLKPRRP